MRRRREGQDLSDFFADIKNIWKIGTEKMRIFDLKTEYLSSPLAVAAEKPRLSWRIQAEENEKDVIQRSARIVVSSSEEKLNNGIFDLWDSGELKTQDTVQHYYGGKKLFPGQDCFWKVFASAEGGCAEGGPVEGGSSVSGSAAESPTGYWKTAIEKPQGKFIFYDDPIIEKFGELARPVCFGKTFSVLKPIRRALLYASALGVYTVRINGSESGGQILAPEWTNYRKRVQYQTYDVTGLLRSDSENELVFALSNGWYSGVWQYWPPKPYSYGKLPELCADLILEYADGERVSIATDESWKCSLDLPVRFAGIYEGENIDGRYRYPSVGDMRLSVSVSEHPELSVVPQPNEPIRQSRKIKAKTICEPEPGIFVADFGENIAGRIALRLTGKRGRQIEIFHNEMLAENGRVYDDNLCAGHFVPRETDRQIVRYTFRGEESGELIRPSFTYMGFRYIELRGLETAPSADDIDAEVFGSDISETGSFGCSDEDINRLQENIIRSSRANFMGVPTDCPQRDERCGYTGDMQFFMPTALHNFDIAAFMTKWLTDLCEDSQLDDGSFTDHAPAFGTWSRNVGWGDAGIICPYLTWREYGDREVIRTHFAAMERYLGFLTATCNSDFTRGPDFCGNGDWLHSGGGASAEIIATTYFAYAASLMAEMAAAVGYHDKQKYYRELCEKIKSALAEKYIRDDGSIIGAGVTGYTLVFTMDLLPDDPQLRQKTAAAFAKAVEDADCRITTGFIGTPRLLPALHMIGRDDLAERLLMRRDCPSWLYPVTVGATTIWERFNGWTEKDGFADSAMNSFNHFAFGSVGDYFYSAILGITVPDFDHERVVSVSPVYLSSLSEAHGKRRVFGSEIGVRWSRDKESGAITLEVDVGANLRAEVEFGGKKYRCGSGKHVFLNK